MSDSILYNSLRDRAAQRAARFHMPGHKGRAAYTLPRNPFSIDYTEIEGTGNLYAGDEPIYSAERHAARVLGAEDCLFLTGGSTLALQTAIAVSAPVGGSLIVDRNCHKSVTHAMALLDLTPYFVFPKPLSCGIPGLIAPEDAEKLFDEHPDASALLVTSPNYYGVMQDISALADICHRRGRLLIVDCAHGAHLRAVTGQSVIEQGADLAAVSTHKTLPALGQSAALLSSGSVPFDRLLETAPIFGTSSPSYLLMSSIELACSWLEEDGTELYRQCADSVRSLRRDIPKCTPFTVLDEPFLDPCRLTISCLGTNVTGDRMNEILCRDFGIDVEMSDEHNIVLICTGLDRQSDYDRLMGALRDRRFYAIECSEQGHILPELPAPERVCSVRQAQFGSSHAVPVSEAVGRVCARAVTPYPPGVPVIYPGERINQLHVEFILRECYTKISEVFILDE